MSGPLVITTGGTIGAMPVDDVQKQPHIKTMRNDARDMVGEALSGSFSSFHARCLAMEPRDSNFIDEAYRRMIAGHILASPENRILLTHGTDTLLRTAEFFDRLMAEDSRFANKRIIVTGAMVPLANGPDSDGYRNLEFSLRILSQTETPFARVAVVLCGFDEFGTEKGVWKPRIYKMEIGKYKRYYHPTDDRYSWIDLQGQ